MRVKIDFCKIRDCHKGGSNSRILEVQFIDLTTAPTVPVWNRELHLLKIWSFIKIGLRQWNFFGVKEFFLVNLVCKNECKNEFQDNNKKSCLDSKIASPNEIDFRAYGTQESHPTAWELILRSKRLQGEIFL